MSERLSRILGSHPDRQRDIARFGVEQTVHALAQAMGSSDFPMSGRVTMTEAASWLALDAAFTPARWDDWRYDVSRVTDALVVASSPVSHQIVVREELASGLVPLGLDNNITEEERSAAAAALMRWQAEELEALQTFGRAVISILEQARAGALQLSGVQKGVLQQLSIDELHLPISFDAGKNSLLFDAARATELRSGLTDTAVSGWTDVTVLAEQIRLLKGVAEDSRRSPTEAEVRAKVIELVAAALSKHERPGRDGIASAVRALPGFGEVQVKMIHAIFHAEKPKGWASGGRPKVGRKLGNKSEE